MGIIDIHRILDEVRLLGCSDLHFTDRIAPVVRLNGMLRTMRSQYPEMDEDFLQNIGVYLFLTLHVLHMIRARGGIVFKLIFTPESGIRELSRVYDIFVIHAESPQLRRNPVRVSEGEAPRTRTRPSPER